MEHVVKASEAAKNITMNIRVAGMRWFRIRMKVGLLVMRFGVWLAGVGCRVEHDD